MACADCLRQCLPVLQMATGTPPNADLHPMRALFLIPKSPAPTLLGPYTQPLKDFVVRCLHKVTGTLHQSALAWLRHMPVTAVTATATIQQTLQA
jgi:serine/threonine-protein kinase 24/25/MST4